MNNDSIYDLSMTLLDIQDHNAEIEFQKIAEPIPEESDLESVDIVEYDLSEGEETDEEEKSSGLLTTFLFFIVLFFIAASLYYFLEKKKKKHPIFGHQFSK